jgi:hypothetical protein
LARTDALLGERMVNGDAETNARLLFKLDVVNLRRVCWRSA